jgi:hypothetical protein
VRATEAGLLDGVDGLPEPPEEAVSRRGGGFSLVTDTSGGKVKKLPSFYVNTSQLYAHRDLSVVRRKLDRAIEAFDLDRGGAYMLTACEIGGRKGLYGTDFFNRSTYRQKLKRLGMRFSDDPFVVFGEDSKFHSEDFEPFDATFLTLPQRSDVPPGVVPLGGALLVYQLTFYRIADLDPEELSRLVTLAPSLDAMSATDPADLVEALARPNG